MEIGIDSFAAAHDETSQAVRPSERLQNLVEEIEYADQAGLDSFGVGEHHRKEFLDSAPSVILGAAASRTKQIRLTSAVTVLSSADPVRVFQQFATVDGLSNGRAEIMAGRGSFIESYPLFGYDLDDYDALFGEKLDLLMKLRGGRAHHVGRGSAARAQQSRHLSAPGTEEDADLDRRGRHTAVGGAGGLARSSHGACHHRR